MTATAIIMLSLWNLNNISDYNILNSNDIKSTTLNSNDIKENNDNNYKNNEETNIILNYILMHGSNRVNVRNNKGIIYWD